MGVETKDFDAEMLDFICCPNCNFDLIYVKSSSKLVCKGCNREFLVKDSIPILLEM